MMETRKGIDTELVEAATVVRNHITSLIPWLNGQITHRVRDWEGMELIFYREGNERVGFNSFDRNEAIRLAGVIRGTTD